MVDIWVHYSGLSSENGDVGFMKIHQWFFLILNVLYIKVYKKYTKWIWGNEKKTEENICSTDSKMLLFLIYDFIMSNENLSIQLHDWK